MRVLEVERWGRGQQINTGAGIHGCLLCCRAFIIIMVLGDLGEGPLSVLLTLTLSTGADLSCN